MNHKLIECKNPECAGCWFCDGLAACEICAGFEMSLPTHCPGIKMDAETQDLVNDQKIDYINGSWLNIDQKKLQIQSIQSFEVFNPKAIKLEKDHD